MTSVFQTLPLEMIREILVHLEDRELCRLGRTCTLFRHLLSESDPLGLWLQLCRRKLLDGPLPPGKCSFWWLYVSTKRYLRDISTCGEEYQIKTGLTWLIQNNCNIMIARYLERDAVKTYLRGKLYYDPPEMPLIDHLQHATELGHAKIVRQLVHAGADPTRAVWYAVVRGHRHVLDLLIELGANPDILGNEVLIAAATSGRLDMLEYGQALGGLDWDGALVMGVRQGHLNIVEATIPYVQPLARHRALRVAYENYCNRTYQKSQYRCIAQRLLDAGATWFDPTNPAGQELTEIQVQEIARYITRLGPHGLNLNGALREAYTSGLPRIAQYLLDQGAQWFDSDS